MGLKIIYKIMGLKMVCKYGNVDLQVGYEVDLSVWHWKKVHVRGKQAFRQVSRVWQMCSSKNRQRQPVFLAFLLQHTKYY